MITGIEDALVLAGLTSRPVAEHRSRRRGARRGRVAAAETAARDERGRMADPVCEAVLSALRTGATDLDDLRRLTSLSARALIAAIGALEVAGVLWTDHTGGVRLAP
jgi:hypothetical protein